MSDQKEMKRRLKALMLKPENQVCSDCPERQPRWASLIVPPPGSPPGSTKIGAFCCLECSGSHRRLGVHISFVRSVNLDSWKESEVLAMENGGNKKVNAIWEANLQRTGGRKPVTGADLNTRERYIRDKYERRKFYDHQALIDYQNSEPSFDDIGSKNHGGDFANFGPPADSQVSDAARLRAEKKKKKTVDRKKSFDDSAKQRRAKKQEAPPPTQTQAEVDLLDLGGGGGGGGDSKPSTNGQASAAPAPFADFFSMDATASAPSSASQPTPTMEPPRRKGSRDGPSRSRSSNRDSNTPDQDTTRKNQQQDILSMYNMQNSSNSSNNGMMNPMAGFNNQPNMMAMMQQMQNMNFNNANSNPQQQQQQYNMGMGQQQMQPQAQQQPFNMQQMQRMMQQMQFNPQMMQAMMQANTGRQNYNSNNKQMNPNMMANPNMNMNMNPNVMMGFNPNMMQQPNSNNNMMMMNNQFGGMNPMGGQSNGTSNSNNNNNANQVPEKEDPFAQFGMNAFR